MPPTRNAIIRYYTLDNCFRNSGRRYFIDNLVEECAKAIFFHSGIEDSVSKRQIYVDIKFMESRHGYNISLERNTDGKKVFYRYEDMSFSIRNQLLNETETKQLLEVVNTLSRFMGMPQFEWVSEITARLDSSLISNNKNKQVIEFDHNKYLKGVDFITPIYNAIIYKKVLKVSYKSFKKEDEQLFIIHPYFLKQYNNRWFLFGLNEESGKIINLALDRILLISETFGSYNENNLIDFTEYFEDVIGVTVVSDKEIEKIVLSVSKTLFPYIQTKPLHGSQKVKERGGEEIIIELELIPNYEFESLLLSFGEGISILEPLTLKNKIKDRIEKMKELYS